MEAVGHLEGAQDGIVGVRLGGGDEGAEGGRLEPGVLVQEIDIVIPLVERVAHAHVVGLGKAQVFRAADEFRIGEMPLHPVRRPVRRVVVPHVQVRRRLRSADAPEAPFQPFEAVERNDDDEDLHALQR